MNYLPWHLARPHLPLRHLGLYPTAWPRPTVQGGSWYSNGSLLGGSPRASISAPNTGSTLPAACQNLTRPDSSLLGLNRLIQSWNLHVPATMPRYKGQSHPRKGEGGEVASTSSHDKPTDGKESKKRQHQAGTSFADTDKPDYQKQKSKHHSRDRRDGKYTWLQRKWIPVENGSGPPKGFDFSLMSYNVLAQGLLEEHRDLYHHCNPTFLSWEYRRKQLIEEIKFFHPDVICMQEVQGDHYYDFFVPKMKKLGYQGIYKRRTHEKIDGCATFFNERKFALDIAMPVEYYNSNNPILDRDNVGLVLLLKLVPHARVSPRKQSRRETVGSTSARLCVANTHLLFNPRRGDVKLAQLCILLAEIDKIAAKSDFSGYHPVILCGDLNFCPLSPLYHFIVGKSLHLKDFSGKDLSGQEESQRGGRLPMSPKNLPPRVGIFDQCQYIKEVAKRRSERTVTTVKKKSGKDADTDTCIPKVENPSKANNNNYMNVNSLGTGVLSNTLKLVSVYGHETLRDGKRYPVISTKHGRSEANVDFMFYSVENKLQGVDHASAFLKEKNGLIEEGDLKLLSKLDLYTPMEARTIGGFPSKYYSSDHIPLMADFRLHF